MKKSPAKLVLLRETIRALAAVELHRAHAGAADTESGGGCVAKAVVATAPAAAATQPPS